MLKYSYANIKIKKKISKIQIFKKINWTKQNSEKNEILDINENNDKNNGMNDSILFN